MDGPILALEVLQKVEWRYGEVCTSNLWTDSDEVVGIYQLQCMSMLPSRSFSRNADMLLKRDRLLQNYGGKTNVVKVKAHQDDNAAYKDLTCESEWNIDCDTAAKGELKNTTWSDYMSVFRKEQWKYCLHKRSV